MTKYILHGGAAKRDTIANKKFFVEITRDLSDPNNILIIGYAKEKDSCNKGLGILPIKVFCHYTEEKSDKLEQLKKYGEEFEVRAIPEEKFFVIER